MSPWAPILIGIGVILIVIGVKGSQHTVLAAFKGVKQSKTTSGTASTASGGAVAV